MLKTILLASAMAVTVPAMAQDMPQQTSSPSTTVPAQDNTVPTTTDSTLQQTPQQTPTTQGAPIAGAPVTDPVATQQAAAPTSDQLATPTDPAASTAPAETASATPTPATGAPVTGESQIAQVVSTEFPTYDKNADKALDKAEFGQWMVALKSASDPTTKPTDPATKKWVDGAFASADTDKSKTVTQTELTTYLSKSAG